MMAHEPPELALGMIAFRVSRPRRTFCAFVCPQSRPTRLMQTDPYYPAPASDKAHYVAHSLAICNAIRTWCVVRQGGRGTRKTDYRNRVTVLLRLFKAPL